MALFALVTVHRGTDEQYRIRSMESVADVKARPARIGGERLCVCVCVLDKCAQSGTRILFSVESMHDLAQTVPNNKQTDTRMKEKGGGDMEINIITRESIHNRQSRYYCMWSDFPRNYHFHLITSAIWLHSPSINQFLFTSPSDF